MKVYPLPFGEQFALQFVSHLTQDIEVEIFNILGKKVYTQSLKTPKGKYEFEVNASEWVSGTYFLQLKSKSKVLEVKRLLKW